MTDEVPPVARGFDPELPSPARIYDCFLGGTHNFAADRAVAAQAIAVLPELPAIAQANRAFLGRAVRAAATAGLTQFLDLGSGIPTVGNVHEVAREIRPAARVAYVDIDPVAVLHSRSILAGDHRTAVLQADLRDAKRILADPDIQALIDFGGRNAYRRPQLFHQVFLHVAPLVGRRFERRLRVGPHGLGQGGEFRL